MPRKVTLTKRNKNRNVSIGNNNSLKRNRKQTRLRKGPNRNNYNNLPKRTRKQSAGMNSVRKKIASAKESAKAAGKAAGKAASDYYNKKTTITQAASKTKAASLLGPPSGVVGTGINLGLETGEFVARGLVGEGLAIATKALAFKIDRTCENNPDFKVSILFEGDKQSEKKIPGLPQIKGRTICGKTYFQDYREELHNHLETVKTKLNQNEGGGLLVRKGSEIKKIGPNTIKMNAEGITKNKDGAISSTNYIVVLAPVNTNKSKYLEKKKL